MVMVHKKYKMNNETASNLGMRHLSLFCKRVCVMEIIYLQCLEYTSLFVIKIVGSLCITFFLMKY